MDGKVAFKAVLIINSATAFDMASLSWGKFQLDRIKKIVEAHGDGLRFDFALPASEADPVVVEI